MAELYIPRERPRYNPANGQFLKGNEPHNKGKKWSDYMGKRAQRRAMKGWKNLEKHRPTVRPDTAGRCRKQVVAVMDDGRFFVMSYIGAAAEWLERRTGGHCSRENIGRCCRENIGRCCRENGSGKVSKHSWRPGQKKGSPLVNTDHKYKGLRWYYEKDYSIWKDKIGKP